MADTKLTALTELTAPALGDWLYAVDVSDTTDDAAGSSRKILNSSLLQYVPHGLSEISVTGATTATIGRMHVCSGTTADYTLTLPAASGNTGKIIVVRMATGLTKLVTIDGNASETIDGATTRVMWAGESAILLCDGSNWFKIGGKSIPMACAMSKSSATSCTNATSTHAAMNTVDSEAPAGLGNTGSGQIDIKRPGNGIVYAETVFDAASGSSVNTQAAVWKNASSTGQITMVYYFATYGGPVTSGPITGLVAGDHLRSYLMQQYGSTISSFATADKLRFLESPTW